MQTTSENTDSVAEKNDVVELAVIELAEQAYQCCGHWSL